VQQTRYLPFGGYRAGNGPNPITSHAYTSQRENMDIGLYYYNARYYAPTLARFLSADTLIPDPTNPQQYNRYTYTLNSPLNYSDPTGHDGMWCNDPYEGGVCGTGGKSVFLPAEDIPPLLSQLDNTSDIPEQNLMPYTSCGETALAMCLQSMGLDESASNVTEKALENGWYFPNDPTGVYTSPENLANIANLYGMVFSGNVNSLEDGYRVLRNAIELGMPIIIDITTDPSNRSQDAAHFVVVWGVDEDGTVYYNDPLGEHEGIYTGAERRSITSQELEFAWFNNSDRQLTPSGAGFYLVVAPNQ